MDKYLFPSKQAADEIQLTAFYKAKGRQLQAKRPSFAG